MNNCTNCIHYDVCLYRDESFDCKDCKDFIDKDRIYVLPYKVGDSYYTIDKCCTYGGYYDTPHSIHCEDCCEEYDGEDRVIEHKYKNIVDILEKQAWINSRFPCAYPTYEDACNRLKQKQ